MKIPYLKGILFLILIIIHSTALFSQASFPVVPEDADKGFVSIFNGRDLDGWDGDPVYWSVVDGKIVGEITPETIVKRNTFLIWRREKPSNFELKLEYRISEEGNSGINYRSVEVPDLPWALKGYQSDIDGKGQWNGQNYEERGRTFLALRGQVTRVEKGKKPEIIGTTGDKDELQSFVKKDGWNVSHKVFFLRNLGKSLQDEKK